MPSHTERLLQGGLKQYVMFDCATADCLQLMLCRHFTPQAPALHLLFAPFVRSRSVYDTTITGHSTYKVASKHSILRSPMDASSFFYSILRWSVAVSTMRRLSSRIAAFLQADARPMFCWPRSASIALGWQCSIIVRTLVSASELSLSCARLLAG